MRAKGRGYYLLVGEEKEKTNLFVMDKKGQVIAENVTIINLCFHQSKPVKTSIYASVP